MPINKGISTILITKCRTAVLLIEHYRKQIQSHNLVRLSIQINFY
jgi:hypothetical protein